MSPDINQAWGRRTSGGYWLAKEIALSTSEAHVTKECQLFEGFYSLSNCRCTDRPGKSGDGTEKWATPIGGGVVDEYPVNLEHIELEIL